MTDGATRIWHASLEALRTLSDLPLWAPLLRAGLLLVAGVVLARLVSRLVSRLLSRVTYASHGQTRVLLQRAASWTVLGVFAVSALRELGFDFAVVLGAVGILTAAAAFASQTSASNVISGLFLGIEGTVSIGDIITVNGVTGEVLAIDMLSTRLRTFDNLMVRIPNETMMKADITNLNRFPIRRYDLRIGVAYGSDLARVHAVLMKVADDNPLVLEEPAPLIIAQGYGASSIDLQLSVWARKEAYLEVRNDVQRQVKTAFDRAGIEIPFPQVTLHAREPVLVGTDASGSATPSGDPEATDGSDPDAARG